MPHCGHGSRAALPPGATSASTGPATTGNPAASAIELAQQRVLRAAADDVDDADPLPGEPTRVMHSRGESDGQADRLSLQFPGPGGFRQQQFRCPTSAIPGSTSVAEPPSSSSMRFRRWTAVTRTSTSRNDSPLPWWCARRPRSNASQLLRSSESGVRLRLAARSCRTMVRAGRTAAGPQTIPCRQRFASSWLLGHRGWTVRSTGQQTRRG